MSTLFVYTRQSEIPQEHQEMLYAFPPDDWDYLIIGFEQELVDVVARGIYIFDYRIKQFGNLWAAVTYHS